MAFFVKFASLFTTRIERYLQTLAVLTFIIPAFLATLISPFLFSYALMTKFAPIAVCYAGWIYYDVNIKKSPSRGGRACDWVRRSRVWVHFKNYFPVSLVKTVELDPGRNYLFGYHPHGIIGCGIFANFGTEATGFSGVFPGIKPHGMASKGTLCIPVLRSLLIACGFCDVSRESIEWILTRQGTGNAAIIVVGGVEEGLEANPGSYNLVLKNRKGFVKMAIQTGACLVPVFSFGENDLFVQANNAQGSYLRSFQEACKRTIRFTPPLLQTFRLLPNQRPVSTVVGRPIEVEKVPDPDQSTIDRVHQQYMNALNELFDQHKVQYGVDKNTTLNFM